ncbi:acylpyruvate hydrolase [Nocardioides sp. YR527]|uniref:fumarylacetoacetate hydrolase family protein n=1 Tax=Nocardioides sp. YR527 TaxID=1881028 RepID=UPI0008812563|nr:fumarylacetoacetate hydrolase family protein [Nocardioides sp. YR527]SDL32641.1 acylpyruvate hydrolase [Nocardioides sp. YR527]
MKLATIRTNSGHRAVRVDGETAVEIDSAHGADVGELLSREDWREIAAAADGPQHAWAELDLAPLVPSPGKVVCVGLNYRTHILEMGRDLPEYPTLFAKFADTLTGPNDDIEAPEEDEQLDWEAELTIVIGAEVRHADETSAAAAIAGFTVANDVSMRSFQFRTKEWLQGKMWERSTPLGPVLVTGDEWKPSGRIWTTVNGEKMQEAATDDLVHGPAALVAYISTITTLRPGDIILTGTPGGVGHARKPPRYLQAGDVVEVGIEGIGELRNRVVKAGR